MSKSFYQITKEVSLLLAGALLGVAVITFENTIPEFLPYTVIILVLLIFYGVGGFEIILDLLFRLVRKINKHLNTICIYAPYDIDPEKNSSWVQVNIKQMKAMLEKKKTRFRIGTNENVFREYQVIVNPYGGTYPEKELSSLRSLEGIFQYVRKGGVYLNIADIPFYFAYDKNLTRKVDTTPLAGDFLLERSFLQTILTKKLHCYVFAITTGKDFDQGIKRVIQVADPARNLFDRDEFEDSPGKGYSPVVKIPYGKGYFIFSTFELTKNNLENHITRVLEAAKRGS